MLENVGGENKVELLARDIDDARPHGAQEKIESNREPETDSKRNERRDRAIRDHPIVDIHREERCGQRKHIHNEGRDRNLTVAAPESASDAPEPVGLAYLAPGLHAFAG